MTYKEFHNLFGTCTYAVNLTKNGEDFIGVYNGLSFWGKVFSVSEDRETYTQVEQFSAPFDEEEHKPFNFQESDFLSHGYSYTITDEQFEHFEQEYEYYQNMIHS
jgi:hypothetical protein